MEDGTDSNFAFNYFNKLVELDKDIAPEFKCLKNKVGFYVSCFAQNWDSTFHWNKYGDSGRGVSIGIRPSVIDFDNYWIFELEYDEKIIEKKVEEFYELLKNLNKNVEEANRIMAKLFELSAKYKDPTYSVEKETRLIYKNEIKIDENGKLKRKELEYDYNNGKIRGCYDIAFKDLIIKNTPKFIDYVFLGPKCELTVHEVEDFLKNSLKNYPFENNRAFGSIKIEKSELIYH